MDKPRIRCWFRILAEVLLLISDRILLAIEHRGDHAFDYRQVTQHPEWMASPFGVGNVVAASLILSITLNTAPFETVRAN
jgi:hypothetical protein